MTDPSMLSTVGTLAIILGTAVSMGGAIVAFGRWSIVALMAQQIEKLTRDHLTPLAESMTRLSMTAEALATSLAEARRVQAADHSESEQRAQEIHRAVIALEKLVAEHETKLRVHAAQIRALQSASERAASEAAAPRPVRSTRRKT